ncbi:DMT family transporter [Comamonas terrae]|uniref:DMT family transporter n=1 Tax=Comamonas terrae TaxID=673548 RepID=UPI000835C8A3|nr:DMT family transporter [Comamonas terrae]
MNTVVASPASQACGWSRPLTVAAVALLCCLLWGSSYPAIKSGYALFSIAQADLPGKLLFAGWRFVLAGGFVLVTAAVMGKPVLRTLGRHPRQLLALGCAQTTLQYVFFYLGLAYTTGVKGSIMNATATFFSVLIAHWFYANDRLSPAKALGCAVGFAGVLTVTLGGNGELGSGFSWLGEGSVVLAALILAASSIYGKQLSQRMDAMAMTGWQLGLGGLVLVLIGGLSGGGMGLPSLQALVLLVYLALLSSAAFTLWSLLLKYNRVSQVTIYNFTVPVFGSVLSALFLGETLWAWHYVLALAMVCLGIVLVTREPAR